jgi:hypothetical protein
MALDQSDQFVPGHVHLRTREFPEPHARIRVPPVLGVDDAGY